jgi:hypothetical protein
LVFSTERLVVRTVSRRTFCSTRGLIVPETALVYTEEPAYTVR